MYSDNIHIVDKVLGHLVIEDDRREKDTEKCLEYHFMHSIWIVTLYSGRHPLQVLSEDIMLYDVMPVDFWPGM